MNRRKFLKAALATVALTTGLAKATLELAKPKYEYVTYSLGYEITRAMMDDRVQALRYSMDATRKMLDVQIITDLYKA